MVKKYDGMYVLVLFHAVDDFNLLFNPVSLKFRHVCT
jgi:hypothetical protein